MKSPITRIQIQKYTAVKGAEQQQQKKHKQTRKWLEQFIENNI